MRKVLGTFLVALLVIACSLDYASAQGQRGPGQDGARFGMRGGGQGAMISDILVLPNARAEQVAKVEEAQRESRMQDFQNMGEVSQEERRAAFQEMREKRNAELLVKLKDILTEKEMEIVKPMLNARGLRLGLEFSALRQIELNDSTRANLQALIVAYAKKEIENSEARQPGQRGQGAERDKLMADIKTILSNSQISAWETKTEELRTEMQNRRPGQGAPRSGQGQGRGARGN